MKTIMKCVLAAGLAVALSGAATAAAEMRQTVALGSGWNAVHIQIAATDEVDDLFRDWPVEWVALYDPAAFLDTKQYSADGSGEGTIRGGYLMWRRAAPELAGFRRVPADSMPRTAETGMMTMSQ